MKHYRNPLRFAVGSISLMTAVFSSSQVTYHAVVIGDMVPPGFGTEVVANDINDLGQVVGYSIVSTQTTYAFLWDAVNGMQNLGDVAGGFAQGRATGISNAGFISGQGTDADSYEAFRWDPLNGFILMGHLPGKINSFGNDVNDAGVVVGSSGSGPDGVPFIWIPGQGISSIGDLPGGSSEGTAYGINNSNQVVGYSNSGFGNRAFLWTQSSGMTDLGDLPGGSFESLAYGINDAGRVTGWTGVAAGAVAFRKDLLGSMLSVPPPPPMTQSIGYGVGPSGAIVGRSSDATGARRAFLWTPATGTQEINPNIAQPVLDGWTVSLDPPRAVNSSGWIAGAGALSKFFAGQFLGRRQAVVLIPQTTLSGTVALSDYVGALTNLPLEITVRNEVGGLLIDTLNTQLDQSGQYNVVLNRLGTFRLGFKVGHWLRKEVVATIGTSSGSCSATLVNGDIDADNEIGIGDYSVLSGAYNSEPGDSNWAMAADLNGDNSVDIADFSILSANYGMIGD